VASILGDLNSWDLDTFALAEASGGQPLFFLGWKIFHGMKDDIEKIGLESTALCSFLIGIEKGYEDCPYHNSMHAADAVNSVLYQLNVLDLKDNLTDVRQYVKASL
jgi:hypothetical protein